MMIGVHFAHEARGSNKILSIPHKEKQRLVFLQLWNKLPADSQTMSQGEILRNEKFVLGGFGREGIGSVKQHRDIIRLGIPQVLRIPQTLGPRLVGTKLFNKLHGRGFREGDKTTGLSFLSEKLCHLGCFGLLEYRSKWYRSFLNTPMLG